VLPAGSGRHGLAAQLRLRVVTARRQGANCATAGAVIPKVKAQPRVPEGRYKIDVLDSEWRRSLTRRRARLSRDRAIQPSSRVSRHRACIAGHSGPRRYLGLPTLDPEKPALAAPVGHMYR